jgi:regulator of sigma D
MEKKRKNKNNFIMNTDWLFDGILDAEQKQYVLLDYFQKMNQYLERMEVYPMFIEISLHLGNMQTLLTQNKILYTDRKLTSNDDELVLSDLKVKDIPVLDDDEVIEYQKILKNSQPQLHDYFNFAKSIWSIVYDSIEVAVKKNKNNLQSKSGFFSYKTPEKVYVWQYTTRRVYKTNGQTKTSVKLIFDGQQDDLTIPEIISTFSKTYEKNNENLYPVFEVFCSDIFPLEQTLLPIFKRKILAYVNQNVKVSRKLLS